MGNVYVITVVGTIAGLIGTGLGGVLSLFLGLRRRGVMSFILEFSAGIMTGVVCFDLLPEAFKMASVALVLIGVMAGCVVAIAIQDFVKYRKHPGTGKFRGLLGTGIVTAIGIALHNFPEGLAVGSGFEVSTGLGLSLMLVIMLHDVPEGMAMAAPLMGGGMGRRRAVVITVLSGLPMGLGALFGALMGGVSAQAVSFCLALSAGTMLYISFGDLIPESKNLYKGRLASLGSVLGILCGLIATLVIK